MQRTVNYWPGILDISKIRPVVPLADYTYTITSSHANPNLSDAVDEGKEATFTITRTLANNATASGTTVLIKVLETERLQHRKKITNLFLIKLLILKRMS